MQVIDIHAHAVLEESMGMAGPLGPEIGCSPEGQPWYRVGDYVLRGVKYRDSPFLEVELRLAAMDKAGIDLQMLSPNPLTYFHDAPSALAIEFCQSHNDALARTVAKHPDRLLASAALPMQDPKAAVAELRRSVHELGFVAAYVGTAIGDLSLDDEAFDELYATLVELDVPLFVHPAPPSMLPGGDKRLARFDLDLLLGFAYEEALAVSSLVLGGVLDRHPELDICISHGGGALPFLLGRFERASRVRPWASEELKAEGFSAALKRLWFDCHVHGATAQRLLVEAVGADRLVFGTNFAGWDQGGSLSLDDLAPSLAGNARQLLRLDGRLRPTEGRR